MDSDKMHWSVTSDQSDTQLLDNSQTQADEISNKAEAIGLEVSELPVRGWVFMDYFAEPDGGLVPLLVENNFILRD